MNQVAGEPEEEDSHNGGDIKHAYPGNNMTQGSKDRLSDTVEYNQ